MLLWESFDVLHKPRRGEFNHWTHCSLDNVTVTHTNMECCVTQNDMQDTVNTNSLCMWWKACLIVWETWNWWWLNCMTSKMLKKTLLLDCSTQKVVDCGETKDNFTDYNFFFLYIPTAMHSCSAFYYIFGQSNLPSFLLMPTLDLNNVVS